MAQAAGSHVARRTALAGVVAALALPAAGCGIRLEDDAPRVPFVPTRTPVPAEPELVALTRDTAALAVLAATVPGPLAADLATIHRRQHTVLRTTLVGLQVPAETLDAAPAPTPSASASVSPSPSASDATPASGPPASGRAELAAEEAAAAAGSTRFADVGDDLSATVAALHAQRYAAAALLTGRPPEVPGDLVAGDRVAELAASTSAAVYFFEVISARSSGRERVRSDATLESLRQLRADQVAGGASPEAAIGHPLPFDVSASADRTRLAREVLVTLRAGYGEHLGPLVASDGAAGLAALTRWLGTVEVLANRWGVALVPFPGLE